MISSATTHAATAENAPAAPQARLVRAAHEFEAQMMKELLKPMTSGASLTGEDSQSGLGALSDDDSSGGATGALGEFASEALGRALSDRGGFGMADRIIKELSSSTGHKGPARAPTVPQVT